ncbi:polysaccharide biosynthesis protein [Pseudooceanicola sp. HF7]|nr:polysaccharide biosynthesis protein [Pseudooceanicola sp. HF7]
MNMRFVTRLGRAEKAAILLALDGLTALAALVMTDRLLSPAAGTQAALAQAALLTQPRFLLAGLLTAMGVSWYLGLHRMQLLAYEKHGMVETCIVAASISAACALVNTWHGSGQSPVPGPRAELAHVLLCGLLFLALSFAARLTLLRITAALYRLARTRKRLLIYGAGRAGQQLAAALDADETMRPVAFLDDTPRLQSLTIAGLRVFSPLRLQTLVQRLDIDAIVLALPDDARRRKAQALAATDCELLSPPSVSDLLQGRAAAPQRGQMPMQALLGRKHLDEEIPQAGDSYRDRVVLVTGAGGSIGAELCRQVAALGPARLVLLDHSELALYTIARELGETWPQLALTPALGSVCEAPLVRALLRDEGVEIALHAAAYKHVPLVQQNMLEGLRNNVLGTKVLAEACADAGVERFILISTDKAVRPSGVMGATKRLAEEIVQDLAARRPDARPDSGTNGTRFAIVRFGNVMGSSGSVIPLFEDQIARGGPVTVTHPEVTRYFMTVTEAVRLVLIAGSFARGGDVLALDMGDPVEILQVARQMVLGAGLTLRDDARPDGDIEIRFTGLREGEKLHEELFIGSDMRPTPHDRILRAQEGHLSQLQVAAALSEIRRAVDCRDQASARAALDKWVFGKAGTRVSATG